MRWFKNWNEEHKLLEREMDAEIREIRNKLLREVEIQVEIARKEAHKVILELNDKCRKDAKELEHKYHEREAEVLALDARFEERVKLDESIEEALKLREEAIDERVRVANAVIEEKNTVIVSLKEQVTKLLESNLELARVRAQEPKWFVVGSRGEADTKLNDSK